MVQVVVVVGALLGLAVLGFRLLVAAEPTPVAAPSPAPEPPAPVAKPAPPARLAAVVTRVEGSVERTDDAGGWKRVEAGERLEPDSQLRTGKESLADLQVGDATRLTAGAETQLGVRRLEAGLQSFKLTRGRLSAVVDPTTGRTVRIENEAGATVEAVNARFAVMSSGQVLAVATETGGVTLASAGKTVQVDAGREAVADGVAPPSEAAPLSRELVLKVARAKKAASGLCALVEGTAPRGAEVFVDDARVELDEAGRFQVPVPRAPGRQAVSVVTRDVSGRTKASSVPCGPAPEPPKDEASVSRLKVDWGAPSP